MATILYVDDDPTIGLLLEDTLLRSGHRAIGARNVPQALQALSHGEIELIISDFKMPGMTGLEFLGLLKEEAYDIPLIMVTGYASIEHAVLAIKAGAADYITKPVRPEQLEHAVAKALQVARLRKENDVLRQEVMALRNERQIIGESGVMRRLLQTVATAAPTRATMLLQGESGTGKELVARALHDQSERADGPFIKLNCAALPEGLVESALFGHERGAFTGAIKRVAGAFERAHGGTLLLDEISEMRLDLQAKLLRVLQEQEFERVGGTSPIKVDVRIVATTNRDLAAEAEAGRFRRDLFFRLSVIPIQIPPLRDRAEDIPLLAYRFCSACRKRREERVRGDFPRRACPSSATRLARERPRASTRRGARRHPRERAHAHAGALRGAAFRPYPAGGEHPRVEPSRRAAPDKRPCDEGFPGGGAEFLRPQRGGIAAHREGARGHRRQSHSSGRIAGPQRAHPSQQAEHPSQELRPADCSRQKLPEGNFFLANCRSSMVAVIRARRRERGAQVLFLLCVRRPLPTREMALPSGNLEARRVEHGLPLQPRTLSAGHSPASLSGSRGLPRCLSSLRSLAAPMARKALRH